MIDNRIPTMKLKQSDGGIFANFSFRQLYEQSEKGRGEGDAFMQRLADDGFLKRRLIIGKSSLARNIAFSSTLFAPPSSHAYYPVF